jgi:hypothetical protein
MVMPPILENKNTSSPSVFVPSALLREARRQKDIPAAQVPSVCVLDPDGDLVHALRDSGKAAPFAGWPCYHTELEQSHCFFEHRARTPSIGFRTGFVYKRK